jgi:type II secretory pathway pseudopilin PulG
MKNRGFTLIEVVLYIGLFGILVGGVIIAAYQLLEGGDRNQVNILIQEEGTFLNRKINWAL